MQHERFRQLLAEVAAHRERAEALVREAQRAADDAEALCWAGARRRVNHSCAVADLREAAQRVREIAHRRLEFIGRMRALPARARQRHPTAGDGAEPPLPPP